MINPGHVRLVGRSVAGLLAVMALGVSGLRGQLPAEEELARLRAAEGFELSLFASEPMITNPAAIDIDTHGRVWVAEIQWYRAAAKTNPPADQIKVLEDTDGDGRADRVTVFAERVFCPMSVCVAGDKVYVATSPDLWVYEDKDGDLRADGPPTRLLTGFGGVNHDHGAHSLILGPDHKWWMAHGDSGFRVRGTDGSTIEYRWGAMLRGELDGSKLEMVAVNFRNSYELCVTSQGEVYCSDNDDDGNESVRICWIVPGGNYGWFGRPPFGKQALDARVPPGTPFRESWHFRGFQPGFVPATLVTGFGSPCGMLFHEEETFGPRYKNVCFHADAGPRVIRAYRHVDRGFGKVAEFETVVWSEGDDYFRPDDVCLHPDGSIYIADWYDGGVGGHAYNDPDRGRIFVLRPKGRPLLRRDLPGPYTSLDHALQGLLSPNLATQYLARERLLQEGPAAAAELERLLDALEPNHRARALWVLDRIGGPARATVLRALTSQDPWLRAVGIRILSRHDDEYAREILDLADDPDPVVRREVLLAVNRFSGAGRARGVGVVAEAAGRFTGEDRYELEVINIASQGFRKEIFAALMRGGNLDVRKLPLLKLMDESKLVDPLVAALHETSRSVEETRALLRTLAEYPQDSLGRELLRFVVDPANPATRRREALSLLAPRLGDQWPALANDPELLDALRFTLDDPEMRDAAIDAIRIARLGRLGDNVLQLALVDGLPEELRCRALRVATQLDSPGLSEGIAMLVQADGARLREEAVLAAIASRNGRAVRVILADDQLRDAFGLRLVRGLMESAEGALMLLPYLELRQLEEPLFSAVVAQASDHPDANVRALYEEFIPPERRSRKLGQSIRAEDILALPGRSDRGRQIFFRSSAAQCASCHAIEGEGSGFGPDLSKIGTKYARDALLETILQPSKAIAPEYIPHVVVSTDGQVAVGFLVERTDLAIRIKNERSEIVEIPAERLESITARQVSLMPELVLKDISAQDAADLLAFLTTLQ